MARASATTVEQNFSRGLITEATAMNFPENAVTDADNCIFDKSGKVIRRYGVDYESGYAITSYSSLQVMSNSSTPSDFYDNVVFNEYEWNTVDGNGSISFAVQQIGNRIVFYRINTDSNIFGSPVSYKVNLVSYEVNNSDDGQAVATMEASFSSGFGYLFVVHPLCHPFYVAYNASTNTFSDTQIDIKTRDFERVNDSLAIDARPSSLTDLHKYNLYNQGWYATAKHTTNATGNVLTYWDAQRTDFPSNADQWWVYKNSTEVLDKDLFDTVALGNSPAPNGHYIYSAFNTTRNSTAGTTGVPEKNSGNYRPSTTAFYAGRIWYSGVDAPGYISTIYFSKIVESNSEFGMCYQVQDPTSEDSYDLLPSDGGVIVIPEAAKIVRLVPFAASLYVFATNGLWKITGPNGVFTANDYSVIKLSNASIKAKNSVVIAEGIPFWWDSAGIYSISYDPQSNQETVANVSETSIQSIVNSIPNENLAYVKGVFNNIDKTAHWLYRSTEASSVSENYYYDKILILNLTTQGFSQVTIGDSGPKICGMLFSIRSNNDNLIEEEGASLVKYFTTGQIKTNKAYAMTVSQFNNSNYIDWLTFDGVGVDAASYFTTGYKVRAELLRKFQSNWIVVVMKRESNASCFLQGIWDYSNSPSLGRYTTTQQLYKDQVNKDYIRTKRRIRGSGYALQLKFSSEPLKPFTVIGWATLETGNVVP